MYECADVRFARNYWHWFFLIQPAPLPEAMLSGAIEQFLRTRSAMWWNRAPSPTTLRGYLAAARDPETVRGWCEDYRAAASIDLDTTVPIATPAASSPARCSRSGGRATRSGSGTPSSSRSGATRAGRAW